jgi:hypothetical protein
MKTRILGTQVARLSVIYKKKGNRKKITDWEGNECVSKGRGFLTSKSKALGHVKHRDREQVTDN